jgi:hypothetical protein
MELSALTLVARANDFLYRINVDELSLCRLGYVKCSYNRS